MITTILEFIPNLIAPLIAGSFFTFLGMWLRNRKKDRRLKYVLNFGNDDIVLVYQNNAFIDTYPTIIPNVSSEDFIAMNNILSALFKIDWKKEIILMSLFIN